MNSSIPRKGRLAYRRDAEEALNRPRLCALVVLKGLRPDPAVGSKVSATGEALQSTDPKLFAGDPAFAVPVVASPQEIRYAQELREQLKKKYLDQPSRPCPPWSVGVD